MLAPDTVLQERYRVIRHIGQGGMGTVYEATDLRLGNTVALKQMLLDHVSAEHIDVLRRAFEREARLLASLRHPALPRVIDHFTDPAGQFLVMEFIPGDDLAALQAKSGGPFPLETVLRWADQLLDALEYLHTQQPPVIHRDIKPQNLKLTPRGEIILLDFGLAKGASLQTQSTTTASIFGYTPQYAPLEQIRGTGTDQRSDLYALAATLYRLATGITPESAMTRTTALVDRLPDPLRPFSEVLPAFPPALGAALMQALSLSATDRPASAKALRGALDAARAGHASPSALAAESQPTVAELTPVAAAPQLQPAPRTRALPIGALIAAGLVLLLAVAGFLALNRDRNAQLAGPGVTALPLAPTTAAATTAAPTFAPLPTAAASATAIATDLPAPTEEPPTAAPAIPTEPPPAPVFPIDSQVFTKPGAARDLFTSAAGPERVFDRPKLFGGALVIVRAFEQNAVKVLTPEGVEGWIHEAASSALIETIPAAASEDAALQPGARIQIVQKTGIPLRQAPQPKAPKLVAQLKPGQQATIKEARGDWLQIALDDGTIGWARWYYDGTRYIGLATSASQPLTRNLALKNPRMTGDDVHALQERLVELGYSEVGEIDSVFGPNTEKAIKHFQQANGLDADGIVGPATWAKLWSDAAARA